MSTRGGNEIERMRARAAELEKALDDAPDEAAARPLADELHRIMDALENVHVLHDDET